MGLILCTAHLVGDAPIGFSRAIQSVKGTGEGHDKFEERTWREKMHTNKDGHVMLPGAAVKNALGEVAKYLSESVPGKGKATWTKHFEAGTMVTQDFPLMRDGKPILAKEVECVRLFVPASGKRGDGKRVWKHFPVIQTWETTVQIYLLDPMLADKPEKVETYLGHGGKFIGFGFYRPRNNGNWGRFHVKSFKHDEVKA